MTLGAVGRKYLIDSRYFYDKKRLQISSPFFMSAMIYSPSALGFFSSTNTAPLPPSFGGAEQNANTSGN